MVERAVFSPGELLRELADVMAFFTWQLEPLTP